MQDTRAMTPPATQAATTGSTSALTAPPTWPWPTLSPPPASCTSGTTHPSTSSPSRHVRCQHVHDLLRHSTNQSLPVTACLGVTSFVIDGATYLVTASYLSSAGTVYKFDAASSKFVQFQLLSVQSPRKWKYAVIGGVPMLATTDNTCVHTSYDHVIRDIMHAIRGFSSVYNWDASTGKFVRGQQLPLQNPQDLCFFAIGSDSYLAVCNAILMRLHFIQSSRLPMVATARQPCSSGSRAMHPLSRSSCCQPRKAVIFAHSRLAPTTTLPWPAYRAWRTFSSGTQSPARARSYM